MKKSLIFMIEGGKAMELLQQHIGEVKRVNAAKKVIAGELGIIEASSCIFSGVMTSVVFPKTVPTGWTRPDSKRRSRPKKGTVWYDRFAAQKGHSDPSQMIAEAFDIPLNLSYTGKNYSGTYRISDLFFECGFLWLTYDGPYAMWIPDVQAAVRECEAKGETVDEPTKSFKCEFDGCRQIEQEEWDILVAQFKLARKKQGATNEVL